MTLLVYDDVQLLKEHCITIPWSYTDTVADKAVGACKHVARRRDCRRIVFATARQCACVVSQSSLLLGDHPASDAMSPCIPSSPAVWLWAQWFMGHVHVPVCTPTVCALAQYRLAINLLPLQSHYILHISLLGSISHLCIRNYVNYVFTTRRYA